MAKLIYGLNQSLDGYVDHDAPHAAPGPELFRWFIAHMRNVAGSIYGRRMYEIMRYWDGDDPNWDADLRAFAEAWRQTPKWVASRALESVGPNATLVKDDIPGLVRKLKAEMTGELEVAGTKIAQSLTELGLIDEYQIYLRPYVLGRGTPFFAGPTPLLRLTSHERLSDDALKLTYVPA